MSYSAAVDLSQQTKPRPCQSLSHQACVSHPTPSSADTARTEQMSIPNPLRLFPSNKHRNTELAVCSVCGALLYRRHLDFHTWWHDRTETA